VSVAQFADKLVLARWAIAQFGVEDFDRIAALLNAPEFEGWAEDALEKITHSICKLEFEDQRPFYDWLLARLAEATTLPDGRVGMLIADVSGKGTSAALYMAELKGLILSLSQIHLSPRELLRTTAFCEEPIR
jgi:hypothetical protein